MNKLLSTLSISIFTWLHGECVGVDSLGNRYYRQRKGKASSIGFGRERRWVVYANEIEASLVPPEWHGWLHHSCSMPPDPEKRRERFWQRPHQPNHTGSEQAYRPPGHLLEGGQRPRSLGDYQAWEPP